MSRPVIAAVDPAHADVAPAALGFLLARLLGEPLLVATAYPVDPGVDNLSPEYSEQLARQAQEAVDRIAANVARGRRSGVAVTTRTFEVAGSTSAWLHRLAEHEGASVLVLGSSRRGSAGRVFPSAVTD